MHSAQRLLEERSWLRGLSASLVGVHEADDLTQETLLVAWTQESGGTAPLGRGWLAGIARRLAMARRRKRAQRSSIESSRALWDSQSERWETQLDAAELAQKAELETEVVTRLLELREPYRETLLLRFQGGVNPAEIARRTGVPAGTVRRRLKVGLDDLRSKMNAAHPEPGAWAPLLVGLSGARLSAVGAELAAPALGAKSLVHIHGVLMAKKVLALLALVAGVGGWWWQEHRASDAETATEIAASEASRGSFAGEHADQETGIAEHASAPATGRESIPLDRSGPIVSADPLQYRIVDSAGVAVSVSEGTLIVGSELYEFESVGSGRLRSIELALPAAVRNARLAVSRDGAWPCVFDAPISPGTHTLVWPSGSAMTGQLLLNGAAPGDSIELTLVRDIGWPEASALEAFDKRARRFPKTVTADSDGSFALRDLPRNWRGWVTLGEDWIFTHPTRRSETFASVDGGHLAFEVKRAPYLIGQLVSDDEDADVGGVVFSVVEQDDVSSKHYATETDAEGRFRWPWKSIGATITLLPGDAPGLMEQVITGLTMPADGVLDLGQLKVRSAPLQTVLVTDPEGDPIPFARIREDRLGPLRWVEASEAGEATMRLKSRDTKLVAEAAGYATTRMDFAWSPEVAVIELQRELRATLTVVGPDGRGRAGVEVHFVPLGESGINAPIAKAIQDGVVRGGWAGLSQRPGGELRIPIPTDEDGVIELKGLPRDAQILCGFQERWEWVAAPLTLSAGADGRWRGELTTKAAGAVRVRGVVTTQEGQGIPGAYLHGGLIPGLRVEEDGSFEVALDGDHEATWLTITARGFATERTRLKVASGADEVQEFRLRPERSLLVRAEDAEGSPVKNVAIRTRWLTPSSSVHRSGQGATDEQGKVACRGLFEGEILILARVNGIAYRSVVRAGESEATVLVESPGELQVTWGSDAGPDSVPVSGDVPSVLVLRHVMEGAGFADLMSSDRVNATSQDLTSLNLASHSATLRWSPGVYRVLLFSEEGLVAEKRATIEAGQKRTVSLDIAGVR
ncbi:MAG: sigma-70 family RNA polymerase sigma factor [Planctomycetota bacterium]